MIGATRELARAAFIAPDQVTETQFQNRVVELAAARGWRVHHTRPARNKRGDWRTPIQGHKGYPDLTLARDLNLYLWELKSQTGRVSADQKAWGEHLTVWARAFEHCSYGVWRPRDWPQMVDMLW